MSVGFTEGVRPGGLTGSTEIRILICYILHNIDGPVNRELLEEVLLGEELVNYFSLADCLAQLREQNLIVQKADGFHLTEAGHTVGQTLAGDVPRSVRDLAVRGVVRAQQYSARKAAHKAEIIQDGNSQLIHCNIADDRGPLFSMDLYMPDDLSAKMVQDCFIENGDDVYKLVLAALTDNRALAARALQALGVMDPAE